ncbi:hypothetical protein H5410_028819 [Solanum commersonii]|uniref:Uncharacterized protein n=1 Tax=Solanum commersonii TaxID=4109 RepID=A0A9J5Z611_SOLCO|nr:hypothetical protein H5410_028819 [Solanum commersonii]
MNGLSSCNGKDCIGQLVRVNQVSNSVLKLRSSRTHFHLRFPDSTFMRVYAAFSTLSSSYRTSYSFQEVIKVGQLRRSWVQHRIDYKSSPSLLSLFCCTFVHSEIPCPKVKGRREGKRKKVACSRGRRRVFFLGLFIERSRGKNSPELDSAFVKSPYLTSFHVRVRSLSYGFCTYLSPEENACGPSILFLFKSIFQREPTPSTVPTFKQTYTNENEVNMSILISLNSVYS